MAELVDALDSKSSSARSAGSIPARGTSLRSLRELRLGKPGATSSMRSARRLSRRSLGVGGSAPHLPLASVVPRASASADSSPDMPVQPRGAVPPESCALLTPFAWKGGREGRAPAGTRGPLCAIARRQCTAAYRAAETSRPSLRSGLTAYAVISREPISLWPPSPRELTMRFARLGSLHLRPA